MHSHFPPGIQLYAIFAVLSVDAIDMSGKHEVDLDTNIWKAGFICLLLDIYFFNFSISFLAGVIEISL